MSLKTNIILHAPLIDSTHGSNLLPIKGKLSEVKVDTLTHINHHLSKKDTNLIGKAYIGRF
ncbi:hypothetical protein [Aliivibrio fischeri]|uniref:hypothetical protein n=1 Tax=Aliivibrio fischeri TaxID=668 RepID=UPI0009BED59F|nr:hypothetical protein [Aliivibrio fischeri]